MTLLDLRVAGLGAVTAAGLTLPQSAASFVAGVAGFAEVVAPDVFGMSQVVARVPADRRLRPDPATWLLNLAARAGAEAMAEAGADPARTVLICAPPESARGHPCWAETDPAAFRSALADKLGGPFARGSRLVNEGPAALFGALPEALSQLGRTADRVLLLGVDSLLNAADIGRLRGAERLQGQTAQGVVPGEGAAAVVLARDTGARAAIRSLGLAREEDTVLGPRQSQGRGMLAALAAACPPEPCPESGIDFVIANFNGERYQALEALVFRSRFYRTRRESLPTVFPAASFGETGAAGGVLALAMAADAFRNGHAPGRAAMLEVASEEGLRAAACLVGETG